MTSERTIVLPIKGMSCQHCVKHVKEALENVTGVSRASVDLDGGKATLQLEEDVPREQLSTAVTAAGYSVPAET